MATTGTLTDGYTGSRATAKGNGGVTASYGDKNGGAFTVACPNGCQGVLSNGSEG